MKDWIKELVALEIYGYKQRKVKDSPKVEVKESSEQKPKQVKTLPRLRDLLIKRELLYPETLERIASASFGIEAKTEAEKKFLEDVKFNDLLITWEVYCKKHYRAIRPEFDPTEIDLLHQIVTKLITDYGANPDLLRKFFSKTSNLKHSERICSFILDLIQAIKEEFEKRFRTLKTYEDFVRYIDENRTKPAFSSLLGFLTRVTFETMESLRAFIEKSVPSLYKDLPSLQAFDSKTVTDYLIKYLTEKGEMEKIKIKKEGQKAETEEETEEETRETDKEFEKIVEDLKSSLQTSVDIVREKLRASREETLSRLSGLISNLKNIMEDICGYSRAVSAVSNVSLYIDKINNLMNTLGELCETTKIKEWCDLRDKLFLFFNQYKSGTEPLRALDLPSPQTLCKFLIGFYNYLNSLRQSFVTVPLEEESVIEHIKQRLTGSSEASRHFTTGIFALAFEIAQGKVKDIDDLNERIKQIFYEIFGEIMREIDIREVKEQFAAKAFDIFYEIALAKLREFQESGLVRSFPHHFRKELERVLALESKLRKRSFLDPQNEEERAFLEKHGYYLLQRFLDELREKGLRPEIKNLLIQLREDLGRLPIRTVELEEVIKAVDEAWREVIPEKLDYLVEKIKKHLEIVEEDFLFNFRKDQVSQGKSSLPEGKDIQSLPGYASPEGSSLWVEPQRKGDIEEVMSRL